MKKTLLSLAIGASLLLGSCASIFNTPTTDVKFTSFPIADIEVADALTGAVLHKGKTPITLNLQNSAGYFQSASYKITFKTADGLERVFNLRSKIHGAYWLNILFGGPIGMFVIDPNTGSMYTLPQEMKYDLVNNTPVMQIKTIDELTATERAALVPVSKQVMTLETESN